MKDEEKNILIDGADIHYSHVPSFVKSLTELTTNDIITGDTSINNITTSNTSTTDFSFPFDLNLSDEEIMTMIQKMEKGVLELKAVLKGKEIRDEDKITRRKLK